MFVGDDMKCSIVHETTAGTASGHRAHRTDDALPGACHCGTGSCRNRGMAYPQMYNNAYGFASGSCGQGDYKNPFMYGKDGKVRFIFRPLCVIILLRIIIRNFVNNLCFL